MKVVSNASPLINLTRVGRLHLLPELFEEIFIPEAVWDEVVVQGKEHPGAKELKVADWVKMHRVANRELTHALRQQLDAGEAEAIVLALESEADLLLMDERLGRAIAAHFGMRYTGLIGVLVLAKRKALITAIKPVLDALRDTAGFRVADALHIRVLRDAGEAV
jgi:predicted nucleic acid-binding protein